MRDDLRWGSLIPRDGAPPMMLHVITPDGRSEPGITLPVRMTEEPGDDSVSELIYCSLHLRQTEHHAKLTGELSSVWRWPH